MCRKGVIPEVKYVSTELFTGPALAPRFVVCVNKEDLNEIAKIYLNEEYDEHQREVVLTVNSLKCVLIEQISYQADSLVNKIETIDFNNKSFVLAKMLKVKKILDKQKELLLATRKDYFDVNRDHQGTSELKSAFDSKLRSY